MNDSIIIDPSEKPTTAVIWLHGLGADGHDFVPIVSELHLPGDASVRFIFPHAPRRPITINGGYKQRAWFDILSLDQAGFTADKVGITASVARVCSIIDQQLSEGIASNKIVLVGFSQGGAIALYTGLTYPKPLAGFVGLSTCLPLDEGLLAKLTTQNKKTPILLLHGTQDTLLPAALGQLTYRALESLQYPVTWHDYAMDHSVCPEEIRDLSAWLKIVVS